MTSASSFPTPADRGMPLPGADGALPPNGRLRDALPPGTLVGGSYRIERTLGQGGFGIVYLAADLALQRPVAIKEFLPVHLAFRLEGLQIGLREPAHRDAFGRGLQSFLREARLLAQFDHPSLVRVYRFWEENQTAYMAMPYYEGPTLAAARQRMLRPPEETWLRDQLLMPLLGALQTLHEGHCLHRDVAPGNILLLPDGRPILLDFGSARRVVGDMTQPLTAIVNPAYAAIEQYAESPNLPQGPWTDLYGLACVAYFALSGRAPAPATVRAVNETALMPAAEVGQAVAQSFPGLHYSPALLAAIDRALSLKPGDRPQTAIEMRDALTRPHVQPDVAFEEPRPAPQPFEEIRIPREPEAPVAPAPAASVPAQDEEVIASEAGPAQPADAGDDEQAAIRATIQTALGEIALWPTIAPRPGGKRGPARVEPVMGAADGGAPDAKRAAGKAHLTVVASVQMRDDAQQAAEPATGTARSTGLVPGEPGSVALPPAGPASVDTLPPGDARAPLPVAPERRPSEAGSDPSARLAEPPADSLRSDEQAAHVRNTLPEPAPADEPFLPDAPPLADAAFGNVSAGEPTLGALPPAGGRDAESDFGPTLPVAHRLADDRSRVAATGAVDEPPASADVLPFEFAGTDMRRGAEPVPQPAPAPRSARGQGLKAAAAVVAAALLGGGLWYAQDLGRMAWQWMGWGDGDNASASAGASSPTAAAARATTTAPEPATPVIAANTAQRTAATTAPTAQPGSTTRTPPPARADAGSPGAQAGMGAAASAPATEVAAVTGTAATSGTRSATAPAGTSTTKAPPTAVAATDNGPSAGQTATHDELAGSTAAEDQASATPPKAPPATENLTSTPEKPVSRSAAPGAKPTRKPTTHVAQAKPGAPSAPATARAACGTRRNFALYYCMKAQCRLARFAQSAECVRLREDDEVE